MKVPALLNIAALAAALFDPYPAPAQVQPTYQEPYRPQFHFTPRINWINDPNGLVDYKGEHHICSTRTTLSGQHGLLPSPGGMLLAPTGCTWKELPVAIPATSTIGIFSGSAVVDKNSTAAWYAG